MRKEKIAKATVLGGGAFGTAIAQVLGRNGVKVKMWVYEPETAQDINQNSRNHNFLKGIKLSQNITATTDFAESLAGTELIMVVIPTPFLRQVVVKQNEFLPRNTPIICCTKGIENSSLLTPIEILIEELPGKFHDYLGALSGPSFAAEMAQGLPTSVLVAANSMRVAEDVQHWVSDQNFRIYTGKDLIGAEICGALKNVIAIACGFTTGLGFGNNTTALLITRGLAEISTLALYKGGHPSTMSGLAGLGDLVLTCTSTKSRNFTVGYRLAKGETMDQINASMNEVAEGVKTCKSVKLMTEQMGIELPLCNAVYEGIWGKKDMRETFRELTELPLEQEFNPYDLFKELQVQVQSKI